MDRSKQLGEGSIPSLLLKFSTPAIVGMLAQAMYNIVDRAFIGQAVGPPGIAGATVAFPFMLVLLACGMLVGVGAAALISIRLGERKREEAELILGNAAVLLVAVGLFLTAAGLAFLEPLLTLFGSSRDVLPYATDYLRIIVLGAVFQTVSFGLNAVIRGEGNPRIAMMTMLIGALLNTVLDPLFLFYLGWGMKGAATATVISQAVSCAWVLAYFLRGSSLLALRPTNLRLRKATCLAILAVGSPPFAMQLAASVMNAILNNQLRTFGGDLAISVMGVVYATALFIVMPIFGLTQGTQPIIGYNYGAEKFDRVKRALLTAILTATAITLAGFVVVMVFPSEVISLFNRQDEEFLKMGAHAIRICLVMLPIVGFQIVSSNYFLAVGKPRQAMFLGLSRQVLLLIPAVLVLPYFFGLNGIWVAIPAADLGSSLLTGTWLLLELRYLGRRHVEASSAQQAMTFYTE